LDELPRAFGEAITAAKVRFNGLDKFARSPRRPTLP
jgi:hypothetical protein